MNKYIAEGIGTFLLVFLGTLAAALGGGVFSIALTFGVTLLVLILLLGPKTGAHVNPAVSLGAWIRGDLSSHDVLPYIIAQFFGAIAGSIILFLLVGRGHSLGEVLLPPESPLTFFQAFIVEGALSFFFVASVLLVRDLPTKKAACVVGGVLFLVHLLALPLSGGGLNPARAIAPVVVSAEPAASALLWIFVSGPFLGGMIAGFLLRRKRVLGR